MHPQTVAKMVARGDLTSRGPSGVLGSLDRDEVLALSAARREAAEQQQRQRDARESRPRVSTEQPPDDEHVWLRTREAAALRVSQPRIRHRGCLSTGPITAPAALLLPGRFLAEIGRNGVAPR